MMDERQINRWKGIVSRFKGKLVKMIKDANSRFDDYCISPLIRQILFESTFQAFICISYIKFLCVYQLPKVSFIHCFVMSDIISIFIPLINGKNQTNKHQKQNLTIFIMT